MVTDDAGPGRGQEESNATDGGPTIGGFARVALALVAISLGVLWTARIAVDGDVSSGVLLRLLPPVALIYLGIRYFRSVVGSNGSGPP